MAAERVYISGVVKNGVIIPDEALPEGARVEILTLPLPPGLQAELDAWETASDEDMHRLQPE